MLFEDKETYRTNAESKETNQKFMTMMQFLESEPEWHDGEVVYSNKA